MLEFAKKILVKVSFDRELFQKELKKALLPLGKKEAILLYSWCLLNFGEKYREVIVSVFSEEQIWL